MTDTDMAVIVDLVDPQWDPAVRTTAHVWAGFVSHTHAALPLSTHMRLSLVRVCTPTAAPILTHARLQNACGPGTIASALPWAFERGTRRPVVAMMWICELTGQLHFDLTVLAHEIFHALVRR